MKKILVIGRDGQLARALAQAPAEGWRIEFRGRDQVDLRMPDQVAHALRTFAPDVVINAGAYTAVDRAESEPEFADAINARGPAALAAACARSGAALIHISTDYVFNGASLTPHSESDPCDPINVYGRTKYEGERAILASTARHAIIRTSWVYSSGAGNFVTAMLKLAETRSEIRVVDDQRGRPTWARDLADACITLASRLAEGETPGLVHFSGSGEPASWAQFAEETFAQAALRGLPGALVSPVSSAEYGATAPRPANSVLDLSRFTALSGRAPRPWKEALSLCLDEIARAKG